MCVEENLCYKGLSMLIPPTIKFSAPRELNGQDCITCPSTCTTCSSSTVCGSCASGYALQGKMCSECPAGTYLSSSQTCIKCTNNCATCSSATICKSCVTGYGLQQGNQCAECPAGTYLDGENCITCTNNCATCSSATVCESCVTGYGLQQGNQCAECPAGTYLVDQTCTNCPSTCATCVSSSICESCNPNYGLQNKMCAVCPEGTYLDNEACLTCPSTCSSCSSSSKCDACKSGYGLQNDQCTECPVGTYLSGENCLGCPSTCASCTGPLNCMSCSQGYGLQGTKCKVCPAATYLSQGVCPDCPVGCSTCTDSETCTACNDGYIIMNNLCEACPSGTYFSDGTCMENPYSESTSNMLSAGQSSQQAASSVVSFLSAGSPTGISAGLGGKIFSNIKYLNITYSDELELALMTWNKSLISFGFDLDLPETVDNMLKDQPLPYNFEKYDVRSSFLANNWQNIIMLLVILAIYVTARGLQWLVKIRENKVFRYSWVRALRIMIQNYFLGQLYGFYGDLLFYSILDWGSMDTKLALSDISVTVSCFMTVILAVNLVLHYRLLRKYQRIRLRNNEKELENFQNDHAGNQVLFKDFRDGSLNQQLFLLYLTIRDLLFSVILTTLFSHPILQTAIILSMNVGMCVYLFMKKPFEAPDDFLQQLVNELIMFIVLVSVFVQALMDSKGMDGTGTRKRLGKIIIYLNIIFNYITLVFMAYKIFLILKGGYLAWKHHRAQKISEKKVHVIKNESLTSSTQLSLDESPGLKLKSAIPKKPSSQNMESFFRGFAFEQANPDYLKNLGAPKNARRSVQDDTVVTAATMDQSQIQSESIETERPLVFRTQGLVVNNKPRSGIPVPVFSMGYPTFQSKRILIKGKGDVADGLNRRRKKMT